MNSSRKCLRVAMAIVLAVCLTPAAAFAQDEAGNSPADKPIDEVASGVGAAEGTNNNENASVSEGGSEVTAPATPEATDKIPEDSGALGAESNPQGAPGVQAPSDPQALSTELEPLSTPWFEFDIGKDFSLALKSGDGCSAGDPHRVRQSGGASGNHISVESGQHYIELDSVNLVPSDAAPLSVAQGASAHIVLKSGSSSRVHGNNGHAGLEVAQGGSVSIGGTGWLEAGAWEGAAGIGASKGGQCGSIAIEGGYFKVSSEGAAIGGGANAKVSISGGQIHALSPSGTYKIGSTDGRVEISGGNILTQDGIQNQNPGYEDINGVRNAYLPNSNTRVYHATITIPDSSGLFKLTESSYNLAGADRFRDNSLHLYLPLGKARGTYKSSSDAKFTQFAFTEVSAANTAAFAISMLFDISNESVILEEGATSKDLPALVYQSNPNTPTSNTLSALSGEQYVKFSGVNLRNTVRSPIQVDRKASLHMELAASTTNTVEATSKEAAGVGVASEGTLYISGTGKLKASQTGSSHYTAIGGSMLRGAGKVIVEDGEIEATGVAGIGGWGAELTIKGGTTTARGTTGGGVSARAILIQAGMIDSRATNGPGIGAESQINGSTLTITGGMVKAVGGGKGNHSWDVYSGRTCIQGGNVDLSLGPFFSAANPNWGLGGDLYPVKLKVAPNADLSGYEVLYARDKWATPEPFPYNLQGAKANAQGEAWLWIPKGVAKLKKKVVTAANYTLDATEDYNPDISSDDELADAFIAIVMEDGSSIFVPDLSEEFSIQEADGTFGQVTASTRPVLLRNGAPLSPDDKGEVSWLYTYGPNDEDICGTWEELVEEHSTNGALNAGEYGIGLLYISGEGEEGLGLLSGSFEVAKKELTPSMVADVPAQTVAQGVQAMPAVSVTDGNPSFVKASDYTVTYGANNVAGKGVGSVTVTATEASNYSGSVTKTFDVNVSTTPGSNSNKTTGVNSGSLAKTGDMLGLGIVGLFAVSVVALVGAVLAVRFKRRR